MVENQKSIALNRHSIRKNIFFYFSIFMQKKNVPSLYKMIVNHYLRYSYFPSAIAYLPSITYCNVA